MSETVLPFDGTNPDRGIAVDAGGNMTYSGASETGRIEIEIPALRGSPNPTETLHAADFGPHVVSRIEASMNKQGYLRSGPQQNGPQTFAHFIACARGAELFDPATLKRGEALSKEFSAEPNQREFHETVIRPWLLSLSPGKR